MHFIVILYLSLFEKISKPLKHMSCRAQQAYIDHCYKNRSYTLENFIHVDSKIWLSVYKKLSCLL